MTVWVSDNKGSVRKWANIHLESPGRKTMPAIKCPIDGCEYTTDDVEATIAAALLNCHPSKHALSRNQTWKTFDEKFHWIQVHEEGKRAQSHLNTSSISAHKSIYQQAKKRSYLSQQSERPMDQRDNCHPQPRTSPASRSGCPGCGSQSHGWGTLLPRKENCPHWLTVCRNCVMNFVLYHYCNLILVIWSAYIGRAVWYFRDLCVCIPSAGSVATGRLGLFTLTAAIFERPSPPLREQSSMIKLWLNHIITRLTPCLKV